MTQAELEAALAEYATLARGWNSYGAGPIAPAAIEAARTFARETTSIPWSAVPLSSGGVQLEVHQRGYDLEIEVKADGETWECFYAPISSTIFTEIEDATYAGACLLYTSPSPRDS